MNKFKKLVNNSAIFALGSFGSKLITFFLVPLYTGYMTVNEYGEMDLIQTTVSLILPILTLLC